MTTVVLPPEQLPRRVQAAGWTTPVYVRGAVPDDGAAIAIVGARAASRRAVERAHLLGRYLASRGIQVVSGGALGVDGAAHRGALAGGGGTTVVLGSGVDVAYPVRHAPLFRDVVASGGALVSMLRDGTQPRRGTFTSRNPLIAALADAVIVVEADVRSGSLSTARAASRIGRVVAAWPGSRGCDRLLASGAALVEGPDDVDRLFSAPRIPAAITPRDPIAAQVHAAIAAGAIGVDAIVHRTGLTVRAVLRALPQLERNRQ